MSSIWRGADTRRRLSILWAITLCLLVPDYDTAAVIGQPVTDQTRHAPERTELIDLASLRDIAPKGRIQDAADNPHLQADVDRLVGYGSLAVDFLIAKLTDRTLVTHHVLDYWPEVRVGDIALVVLTNLFTNGSGRGATIPGAAWDEMLERRDAAAMAAEVLNRYVTEHGRRGLQRKWAGLWRRYKAKVIWDPSERCFRLVSAGGGSQATGTQLAVAPDAAQHRLAGHPTPLRRAGEPDRSAPGRSGSFADLVRRSQ